jgi:hypothetical protein
MMMPSLVPSTGHSGLNHGSAAEVPPGGIACKGSPGRPKACWAHTLLDRRGIAAE